MFGGGKKHHPPFVILPVKKEHVCQTRAVLARPLAVGARAHWRHEPMQLACSSGPPSLEPAQPALHRTSTLFVAGDRFTYAPLARINVTFAQSMTRANLDAAMNLSDAARAQWRAIASMPSAPRIAILGTSPTAGCGAAEDVPGGGKSYERGVGLDRACLVELHGQSARLALAVSQLGCSAFRAARRALRRGRPTGHPATASGA